MKSLFAAAGLAIALVAFSVPAQAACTNNLLNQLDRPTVTNSACVVDPGTVIEEIGITKTTSNAGTKSFTYPQSFTRIGISKRFELTVLAPDYQRLRAGGLTTGFADAGVGAKLSLLDQSKTAVAIEGQLTVPENGTFTNQAPNESLGLDLSRQLNERFSLAGTLGYSRLTGPARSGVSSQYYAVTPSIVLTDNVSSTGQVFVEAFGANKTRPDGGRTIGEQAGLQFLLTSRVAFDIEGGQRVVDTQRSNFLGLGFGIKL